MGFSLWGGLLVSCVSWWQCLPFLSHNLSEIELEARFSTPNKTRVVWERNLQSASVRMDLPLHQTKFLDLPVAHLVPPRAPVQMAPTSLLERQFLTIFLTLKTIRV